MVLCVENIAAKLMNNKQIMLKPAKNYSEEDGFRFDFIRAVSAENKVSAGQVAPYDAAFVSGRQCDAFVLTQMALERGASVIILNRATCPSGTFAMMERLCDENRVPLFLVEKYDQFAVVMRFFCEEVLAFDRDRVRLNRELQELLMDAECVHGCQRAFQRYGDFLETALCTAVLRFVPKEACAYDANVMPQLERFAEIGMNRVTADTDAVCVGNHIALIFDRKSVEEITRAVEAVLTAIPPSFASLFTVYIGIGRECHGISGLKESFYTALKAADMQAARGRCGEVRTYESMGVSRLLLELGRDNVIVNEFYRETMVPLLEHDRKGGEALFPFLKAYFRHNGCKKKIGEALYLHRNSVNYKVARIHELSGRNLSNVEQMTEMMVGMYLHELMYGEEYDK